MLIAETLTLTVGSAVAKTLLKIWFGDSLLATNVSLGLAELIGQKTQDALTQRRVRQQFSLLGDRVAAGLAPIYDEARLPENSQAAIAAAVSDTLNETPLSAGLLVGLDLSVAALAAHLLMAEGNARFTVGFGAAELALYERSIRELSWAIVEIAGELPRFSEQAFTEVLQRETLLIANTEQILTELRTFRQESRQPDPEIVARLEEISTILEPLRSRSVTAAFHAEVTRKEDRERAGELIRELEASLREAGQEPDADTWYLLGLAHIAMNELERGEASFLAATESDPAAGSAYMGLAMIYQLRASNLNQNRHYTLAGGELEKASHYARQALQHNTEDALFFAQLGYVNKDLGQRLTHQNRQAEGQAFLDKATANFRAAIGIDPLNASAHNGIGNVHLLRGEYDEAVEWSTKATEIEPDYFYAYLDLAGAYYGKGRRAHSEEEFMPIVEGFRDAMGEVIRLLEAGAYELTPSMNESITRMANFMTARTLQLRTPAALS